MVTWRRLRHEKRNKRTKRITTIFQDSSLNAMPCSTGPPKLALVPPKPFRTPFLTCILPELTWHPCTRFRCRSGFGPLLPTASALSHQQLQSFQPKGQPRFCPFCIQRIKLGHPLVVRRRDGNLWHHPEVRPLQRSAKGKAYRAVPHTSYLCFIHCLISATPSPTSQ